MKTIKKKIKLPPWLQWAYRSGSKWHHNVHVSVSAQRIDKALPVNPLVPFSKPCVGLSLIGLALCYVLSLAGLSPL